VCYRPVILSPCKRTEKMSPLTRAGRCPLPYPLDWFTTCTDLLSLHVFSPWRTGCTNYAGFRDDARQNGAPRAPFSRFRRPMITKMVHRMHHSSGFQASFVQNGVLDAPITLVFGLLPAKTVHHMHQSFCFLSPGGLKWRTTCAIIPGFA
jgi:hypothetical protein